MSSILVVSVFAVTVILSPILIYSTGSLMLDSQSDGRGLAKIAATGLMIWALDMACVVALQMHGYHLHREMWATWGRMSIINMVMIASTIAAAAPGCIAVRMRRRL